jgi:hypothetical protein
LTDSTAEDGSLRGGAGRLHVLAVHARDANLGDGWRAPSGWRHQRTRGVRSRKKPRTLTDRVAVTFSILFSVMDVDRESTSGNSVFAEDAIGRATAEASFAIALSMVHWQNPTLDHCLATVHRFSGLL